MNHFNALTSYITFIIVEVSRGESEWESDKLVRTKKESKPFQNLLSL